MDEYKKKMDVDRVDLENINKTFRTGELTKNLGLSRDTLRYYEEIGLITPEKNADNNYRKFNFYDIFNLWGIDFFKKRGLSLVEIQHILEEPNLMDLRNTLQKKEKQMEVEIQKKQKTLLKMRETRMLCETLESKRNTFSVQNFPLYEIKSEFSATSALEEYNDKVLDYLDLEEEDILSNMIRKMTFNGDGYQDTIMYMVEKVDASNFKKEKQYLRHGKCVYTIVESGRFSDSDNHVAEETMRKAIKWSKKNKLELVGEVYLKVQLILFQDGRERAFIEAWSPIKSK